MTDVTAPSLASSAKLPSGHTYSYINVPPKDGKPYVLFLHGFPDSSYGWRRQIPFFQDLGYGLIVPDLLGYGNTDKPLEFEAYSIKKMSGDIVALLDVVGIDKVISVAHDWGSNLQTRLAVYYPERFSKFVWLDIGYRAPGPPLNIEGINQLSTKLVGYPIFAYWDFFNSDDAADLINARPAHVKGLVYGGSPAAAKEIMCVPGATRKYFESDTKDNIPPLVDYASEDEMMTHAKLFHPAKGGSGPPLNWYKAAMRGVNDADDAAIPEENKTVKQPTLLVTCGKDYIAVPAMQVQAMKDTVPNLKVEEFDCGHWVQLEMAEKLNQSLKTFIEAS